MGRGRDGRGRDLKLYGNEGVVDFVSGRVERK